MTYECHETQAKLQLSELKLSVYRTRRVGLLNSLPYSGSNQRKSYKKGTLMATVRIAPNEVQVDEVIYTFADAEVADIFESCVATTGDVTHCAKDQITLDKRPATRGMPISQAESAQQGDS
jgi:hypothetical protein